MTNILISSGISCSMCSNPDVIPAESQSKYEKEAAETKKMKATLQDLSSEKEGDKACKDHHHIMFWLYWFCHILIKVSYIESLGLPAHYPILHYTIRTPQLCF